MGGGGFGGSSEKMRGVEESARVANRDPETTRARAASILAVQWLDRQLS